MFKVVPKKGEGCSMLIYMAHKVSNKIVSVNLVINPDSRGRCKRSCKRGWGRNIFERNKIMDLTGSLSALFKRNKISV